VQDLADLQQPTAMPTSQTTHSSSLAVLPMQKQVSETNGDKRLEVFRQRMQTTENFNKS